MKLHLSILVLASVTGCAPWMDAQSNLVVQARRGIEVAQENRATCAAAHEQLARLKRQRLDEAFDADVRSRDPLTADWVIAHRAAYAAALEAYAQERHALAESDDVAQQNLRAVDAALERLQWLHAIQSRWLRAAQPEDKR